MQTIMQQEAESTWLKVNNQLEQNKHLIKEISTIIKSRNIKRVITIARGSSDCVANFSKYLFESQLGWMVASLPPSIATLYNKNIGDEQTLAISISQSGGSPDLKKALENCKNAGCLTLAIVNNENSPLAKVADMALPIRADEENAIAATKSFIASLTALVSLIAELGQDSFLKEELLKLPSNLKKIVDEGCWSSLAKVIKEHKSMFVIGRGFGYPIAQEMALKFKETCGIHAEAFSGAEVLHGPFALMNDDFVSLSIAQNDESLQGTQDVVSKMTELGVKTIFISNKKDESVNAFLKTETNINTHSILEPIVLIQKFYLMINRLALDLGYNPDSPTNLKKVTQTV